MNQPDVVSSIPGRELLALTALPQPKAHGGLLAPSLRPRWPQPGRDAPLIAVWGGGGAPGRSFVAFQLAVALAVSTTTCLLIDASPGSAKTSLAPSLGVLHEWSGLAVAHDRAGAGALRAPTDLLELAVPVASGVSLLTGGTVPAPRADAEAMGVVWTAARQCSDAVVVDCSAAPALASDEWLEARGSGRDRACISALWAADIVVVVGAAEVTGLARAADAVWQLRQEIATPAADRPILVVNRARGSSALEGPLMVPEGAESRRARADGGHLRPLVRGSPAGLAIERLAAQVRARHLEVAGA